MYVSPFGHIVQDVAAQSPFGPFEPTTSPSLVSEQNAQPFGFALALNVSEGPSLTPVTLNVTSFGSTHAIKSVQINDSTYILVGSNPYHYDFYIINITDIDSPRIVNVGDIVSMIMLLVVRSSCVALTAYGPEAAGARMLNVRLPFVSL